MTFVVFLVSVLYPSKPHYSSISTLCYLFGSIKATIDPVCYCRLLYRYMHYTLYNMHIFWRKNNSKELHVKFWFSHIACFVELFIFSLLAIDMIGNAPSLSFVISIRSTRCNTYMYLHHRKCWVQHVVPVWCMIIQIISTLYTQCNFQIRFSILIYIKNTKLDI